MTFIKINDVLYPAIVNGKLIDSEWDNRESKLITLEMNYETANCLFVDGLVWSIVMQEEYPIFEADEKGEHKQVSTEMRKTEFDNSEYNIAGDITDHRDGTITVKMGKLTELEQAYEIMLGGT